MYLRDVVVFLVAKSDNMLLVPHLSGMTDCLNVEVARRRCLVTKKAK